VEHSSTPDGIIIMCPIRRQTYSTLTAQKIKEGEREKSHFEISLWTLKGQKGIEKSIAKIRKLFEPSFQISRIKKIAKRERERG